MEPCLLPITAAEVAKRRLEQFIEEVTKDACLQHQQVWGIYTRLLKQAKKYKPSAEINYAAYMKDDEEGGKNLDQFLAWRGYHGSKERKP